MPEVNVPVVGEVESINFGAARGGRSTKYDWADACERSCSPKSESSGCSESCDSLTDSGIVIYF